MHEIDNERGHGGRREYNIMILFVLPVSISFGLPSFIRFYILTTVPRRHNQNPARNSLSVPGRYTCRMKTAGDEAKRQIDRTGSVR